MKNVGIIGAGKWGKNLIKEFNKVSNVKAVCTRGGDENVLWLNKHYPEIKHTKQVQKILDDNSLDAVVIATPIHTHFELAKKALEKKKHVFVEKPTATKILEVKDLCEIAKKNNKVLFTGYIYLYHECFKFIKKTINLKDIKSVKFEWNKMGSFNESIFWNLLCHDIAICIDLFETPNNISVLRSEGITTLSDRIEVELAYENMAVQISINRMSEEKIKKVTIKEKDQGYFWEGDSIKMNDGSEETEVFRAEQETALSNEVTEFLHLVEENKFYFDATSLEVVKSVSNLIGQVDNN